MKDFIVLIAMIALGTVIFMLILGDDNSSMKSAAKRFMEAQVQAL